VVDEVAAHLAEFDRHPPHRAGDPRGRGAADGHLGHGHDAGRRGDGAAALPAAAGGWQDARCEAADQALGDLFALGREGLAAHPCVGPDRVEFVLPGCAVYAAIRRVWPVPRLTVADRGLREGMLLRMMRADAG
jgi:exopolyphosphatase / guanosine-5'-triphosphate,3'-diphosphate pyrophosphatase